MISVVLPFSSSMEAVQQKSSHFRTAMKSMVSLSIGARTKLMRVICLLVRLL